MKIARAEIENQIFELKSFQEIIESLPDRERFVIRIGHGCGLYLAHFDGPVAAMRIQPLHQTTECWTRDVAEEIASYGGSGCLGEAVSLLVAIRDEIANYQAMLDLLPA